VLQTPEQVKVPEDDLMILPSKLAEVEKGMEKGAFVLLERMRKLREKTASYVSKLVSDGPRFMVSSVRSVEDESVTPPSLILPLGTLEEECSATIVGSDLACLHRLLQETPFNKAKVLEMIKLLMGHWGKMYSPTLPTDLELLTTHLGALAQRLDNGATFEEVTLSQDEESTRTHLRRLEDACSEVDAEFASVKGSRAELMEYHRKAVSSREKQDLKVTEYKTKVMEYEEKVKTAQKRGEELRRLASLAAGNIGAFDRDVELQGDNIGRLVKLRDEMKSHAAHVDEEKKRLQAQPPADVAIILAYSVKKQNGEAAQEHSREST
jgi:hypothetical protein